MSKSVQCNIKNEPLHRSTIGILTLQHWRLAPAFISLSLHSKSGVLLLSFIPLSPEPLTPVDNKKAEEQLQYKFSKDITEFSISFETPLSTSSDFHDSLLFYLTQWPESVMRAKITLEGQCDLATCLSDNISMHALNHLQVLLSHFLDFDRRRSEAISAASGPILSEL